MVAHRGASALFPENTLAAFEGAIQAGADYIELDVRLTADGVPVIMHDADVGIRTNGSGFVHTFSLRELKRLDASGGLGPAVGVPTLAEALDLLSGQAGVNIEIKNMPGEPSFDSPRERIAEEVVRLLAASGFQGPTVVSSFNWLAIERVRDLNAEIPTGFLTNAAIDPWAALVYARTNDHAFVLPQAPALLAAGPAFIDQAHQDGLRVGTWTVDDPAVMRDLFAMGVDAVATNDPAMAVPIRDQVRAAREGSIQDR